MLGQIGKAPEVVVAKGMPEKAKFDGCGGLVIYIITRLRFLLK